MSPRAKFHFGTAVIVLVLAFILNWLITGRILTAGQLFPVACRATKHVGWLQLLSVCGCSYRLEQFILAVYDRVLRRLLYSMAVDWAYTFVCAVVVSLPT
jgi:hypothetical protein